VKHLSLLNQLIALRQQLRPVDRITIKITGGIDPQPAKSAPPGGIDLIRQHAAFVGPKKSVELNVGAADASKPVDPGEGTLPLKRDPRAAGRGS
jgi:hypothetical protein